MALVRPVLPSQTISSTIGACHAWDDGGIGLSSSVETTCISKQYWVSGQSGVGFLTRDQDEECDGVLPNASGSSGLFLMFVGVRVLPSICILTSGFKSSRLLNLVAIDTKTVVMNWNSGYVHTVWEQRPLLENKDTNGLAVSTSYPWWVGDPFIHHQQIPLQMGGHFLPGKRYSLALSNHQIGNLRDGHKPPHLHTAEPDLWDPATSFSGPPRDARKCDSSWGSWMDWWVHQSHDLSHMHQLTLKNCGPCHSNTGFKQIWGVSYLANPQATEVNLTQGV